MNWVNFIKVLINRIWGLNVLINVLRTRLIIELEKLSVHNSLVGLMVESYSNWWYHKYIIYKLLKFKIVIKIKIIIYILFKIYF